ncbi:class I SAM-dependent methyltransferase [Nesterenkonia populi]|uniref:class I SAM-dependent methyltransferase n=1 Tax=Nesterenkonia populi TaxID=1591087 RepID=UPI0014792950|nr:class I SAM-dependent methyltransferase [Nesterenkonia populi]
MSGPGRAAPRRPKRRTDADPQITSEQRRRALGGSFSVQGRSEAEAYDALRPRYPEAAVAEILRGARRPLAADLGAGTGILARQMLAAGASVTAVEPSASMTSVLAESAAPVTVVNAPAEETGLPSGEYDVVTAAQAWHWFDPQRAQAEAQRLLKPGGRLALIWNYIDTSDDVAHRLTRIMRAGDVFRPGWRPALDPGRFGPPATTEWRWSRSLTVSQVFGYATTLSSWLSAEEGERARRRRNLCDYLGGELGLTDEDAVEIPMITGLHVAQGRPVQYS